MRWSGVGAHKGERRTCNPSDATPKVSDIQGIQQLPKVAFKIRTSGKKSHVAASKETYCIITMGTSC